MPNLKPYAFRLVTRCISFYIAFMLVQLMFDGKVAWLGNLIPAVALAVLLTYVQVRLEMLRRMRNKPR
jgi:hypothetical protein